MSYTIGDPQDMSSGENRMKWWRKLNPRRLLREEPGQAATEYALLAMWTVIVVIVAFQAVEAALLDYYQDTASLLCLPIP